MKNRSKRLFRWFWGVGSIMVVVGGVVQCSGVQSITRTLTQLALPAFRLHSLEDLRLLGFSLVGKSTTESFSIQQLAKLQQAFQQQQLPLEITMKMAILNTPDATARRVVPLTIRQLRWRLWIDQKPTIGGEVRQPIRLAVGDSVFVPIVARLDLYQFFADQGFDRILRLVQTLAGQEGIKHLALDVQPVLEIPVLGIYEYPKPIRVISTSFRRQ